MQLILIGIMSYFLAMLCNGYGVMETIFQFVLCFIFYSVMIFIFFNAYVPLLWIPYVLVNIIRGNYKANAIIPCVCTPLIWNIIFIIIFLILFYFEFTRNILYWISPAFLVSVCGAGIITLFKCFSTSSQNEFKELLNKFKK